MATNTVSGVKKEEERYLAERTTQWLEGLLGQKLSSHGLSLAQVLCRSIPPPALPQGTYKAAQHRVYRVHTPRLRSWLSALL